jgi:hypothetical protein
VCACVYSDIDNLSPKLLILIRVLDVDDSQRVSTVQRFEFLGEKWMEEVCFVVR